MRFCLVLLALLLPAGISAKDSPNILFAIADDWGYHASVLGEPVVQTPTFDKLAKEGVLFENAFCASPSCTPSRGALLTGKWHWRLGPGANLYGTVSEGHAFYPDILEEAGYHVGYSRKGWGPGQSRGRNPAGEKHKNFDAFLEAREDEQPFCFWFGSHDPHRGYRKGSGKASGMDLAKIRVPECYPDSPEVRGDIADYLLEVQRFDRETGELIQRLRELGELDNTIVIMTSDHGRPFPRAKSNLYDEGARIPFVIRHPKGIAGTRVSDFVSLIDVAPTLLAAAGLPVPEDMDGVDLRRYLTGLKPRAGRAGRDHILIGKERHVPSQEAPDSGGYPMRAIRTHDYLLIKNYEVERWPSGTPHFQKAFKPNAWYADCDNGPTKSYIVENRDRDEGHRRMYDICFGKRPAIELYDLKADPEQVRNVAEDPAYQATLKKLKVQLERELVAAQDPRETGGAEKFDQYPYSGGAPRKPGS